MKMMALTFVLRQRFRDLALLEELVTQFANVLGDLQAGRRVLLEVAGVILRVVLIVVTIGGLGAFKEGSSRDRTPQSSMTTGSLGRSLLSVGVFSI